MCLAAPCAPQGPVPQRQHRFRRWGAGNHSTAEQSPGCESSRTPMPHGSPWCLSISAPSARGPGAGRPTAPAANSPRAST
ncbi:hypothetical protein NDU88_000925 [Pleurodeles waltl]|uniref:Uncharacterized protein n=1 Tax=Pleurodeles waltl TaxID=8319 RepID=A0AAV7L899_PLEWA|nr:hypothetical protein NDU88_000925 [Pleurodeles waltl]